MLASRCSTGSLLTPCLKTSFKSIGFRDGCCRRRGPWKPCGVTGFRLISRSGNYSFVLTVRGLIPLKVWNRRFGLQIVNISLTGYSHVPAPPQYSRDYGEILGLCGRGMANPALLRDDHRKSFNFVQIKVSNLYSLEQCLHSKALLGLNSSPYHGG